MQTIAIMKAAPVSDQKARLVADQVRGLPVAKALNLLTFSPKKSAVLIKKVLKLDKGSPKPHVDKVGKLTRAQAEEIAKIKIKDLTGADLDAAVRTVAGTARSMGITVEGVN